MSVSCIYCVVTGKVLCNGPITRPELSFQNLCVSGGDVETQTIKKPATTRDVLSEMFKLEICGM